MNKKRIGLLCLSALALLQITGCSSVSDNSSPSSGASPIDSSEILPPSSESDDGDSTGWTKEQKELLKTYCGEVLPYSYFFEGNVSCEVIYDEDNEGYSYLEIKDESPIWSLETYFLDLQENGWTPIYDYSDNAVQTNSSGSQFVEVTKVGSDEKTGYDIFCFFAPESVGKDGEIIPSGNMLRCYNDLQGAKSKATNWSEDDLSVMDIALTYHLPFMAMGEGSSASLLTMNSMAISDTYAQDLSLDYIEILEKDGFVLEKKLSAYNNVYVLSKTLNNGAIIDVLLSYYGGNYFYAEYTPLTKEYSAWPSDIFATIKEKSGVDVPEFKVADGGKYIVYQKNDSYYVYTWDLADEDSFDYEDYSLFTLNDPRLTWDETIDFDAAYLPDENWEWAGYLLAVNLVDPTSTFVSSWPTEAINDVVKNVLGASNVNLPALDAVNIPSLGKQVKYVEHDNDYYQEAYAYYSEDIVENYIDYGYGGVPDEETIKAKAAELAKKEIGIKISILDLNHTAYNAYAKLLYEMGWFEYHDKDGYLIYEDPEGKVAVSFAGDMSPALDYMGETIISIREGSGEKHEEAFYFAEEKIELVAGGCKALGLKLVKSMLPYDVTFSIEGGEGMITIDEDGFVWVNENAEIGTTATVTASISVPGESSPRTVSCTITVKKDLNYSSERAIDAVIALLKEQGYEAKKEGDDPYQTTINFGSTLTLEEIKTLVEQHLIPEGFTRMENWDKWIEGDLQTERAVYNVKNDDGYWTLIKYHVYKENGNSMLMISAW